MQVDDGVDVSLVIPSSSPLPAAPVRTSAPADGSTGLPLTGGELAAVLLLAVLLLAAGALLVRAARPARPS